MNALDNQATDFEATKKRNEQEELSDYSKPLDEETRHLDLMRRTGEALQATFRESRTNDACTRADVWDLMLGGGIQHQKESGSHG